MAFLLAGRITGDDFVTYDAWFEAKPFSTSSSGSRIVVRRDKDGSNFPEAAGLAKSAINRVVWDRALSAGWQEHLKSDLDNGKAWKRGHSNFGAQARLAYLTKVWNDKFGATEGKKDTVQPTNKAARPYPPNQGWNRYYPGTAILVSNDKIEKGAWKTLGATAIEVIQKVFKGSILPIDAKSPYCTTTSYRCVEAAFFAEGWKIVNTDFMMAMEHFQAKNCNGKALKNLGQCCNIRKSTFFALENANEDVMKCFGKVDNPNKRKRDAKTDSSPPPSKRKPSHPKPSSSIPTTSQPTSTHLSSQALSSSPAASTYPSDYPTAPLVILPPAVDNRFLGVTDSLLGNLCN